LTSDGFAIIGINKEIKTRKILNRFIIEYIRV
jgi:hypothetical protein